MKRGQRRGALGRLRGRVRRTTPERLRAAKAGERRPESRTRGEAGGGREWQKTDPSPGRNSHPHDLVPPTVVPHAGKKVGRETRVRWEQAGSRTRHPRPWRPNFGIQVPGKTLSFLLTNNLVLGKSRPIARAGRETRGVPENPQFSRRTQAAPAAARETGSRRGVGRELAARYVALINPQSVHLIPGSKPEPGGEAGQCLLLS